MQTKKEVLEMLGSKLVRFVEGNPREVDLSYVRW
jgi:hypothetical protein